MQATSQHNDETTAPSKRGLQSRIEWLLTSQVYGARDPRVIFWLALSLAFSIYLASLALQQAFGSDYVLQDDARHHVFWTARFADAELFSNDLIADYFQSVAPQGYRAMYKAAASLGLDPYTFSKLLPMALGLITTFFCFAVSMQFLAVPGAAFAASLVLNESLWLRNGLVSATPRAFISPIFLAFLFFLSRNSAAGTIVTVALMGLFFPSIMFIALGVVMLRLVRFERWRLRLARERRDYIFCAVALAVAAIVIAPYTISSSGFGPVVTASEARQMAEFLPRGRMAVFREGFLEYWFTGSHTGMFSSSVFSPLIMYAGLLLPVLMTLPKQFPLVKKISAQIALLPKVVIVSLAMFFAANLLLFRLYLPSRFTVNSFRIVLALAAGVAAITVLDAIFRFADRLRVPRFARSAIAAGATVCLAAALVLPQAVTGVWVDTRYKTGQAPRLYEFLAGQPKDILVASLSDEADNLNMFSRRSILVAKETALPFHKGYYSQIRQRAIDLINAQYSADTITLQNFIQKYGVDYLLVDRNAFTPEYISGDRWIMQFQPAANDAVARLKEGVRPALSKLVDQCSALEINEMVLIPADCLLQASPDDFTSEQPR
jgi:hypothetical protein